MSYSMQPYSFCAGIGSRCALVAFFCTTALAAQANPPGYTLHQRQCLPWIGAIARVGNCGHDYGVDCNVTALAAACTATPTCNAFNTNGFLHSCPTSAGSNVGSCDCDGSQAACRRGQDIFNTDGSTGEMFGCNYTDTYTVSGIAPPAEWIPSIAAASMLYASPEPNACYMPEVGNGYLGSVMTWNAMYVAGLYNGACGTVTRARMPSTLAVSLSNATVTTPNAASADPLDTTGHALDDAGVTVTGSALDMANGVYRRRWSVGGVPVEQRVYAHRSRRNVALVEFELLCSPCAAELAVITEFNPSATSPAGTGDGCAGSFTLDFKFNAAVNLSNGAQQWVGATLAPGDEGEIFNVSIVTPALPATILLNSSAGVSIATFVTAVATSLDFENDAGTAADVAALSTSVYDDAVSMSSMALMSEHVAAWAQLWSAGIDVTPASIDPGDVARTLDIATHVNSSMYYILSAVREDWAAGVSPGGIATENYQGAVFMDEDWWVLPSLYLLAPPLAASILEYRWRSLNTTREIATLFGYGGAMYAWTAAYKGRPFGCCSGHGEYEDCLEHHVTGDVAFAAWQYYAATGNVTWLAARGFDILSGTADFALTRVNGTHVRGVLPIDEWCVDSGCGCETGVDDDAQMNAVTKLSLQLAAQAADVLNVSSNHSALWRSVGDALVLLMNASGHHDQFNSPTCPDGWGGSHYFSSHTVCPEDVMLLTYPLGDALGTPANVSAADAALFIPLTCKENAGMTTGMHVIVYLQMGNVAAAEAEFNRSMHGAAYGPFNVRNEVDKHADIVGGHFDNTHFVTGDGGFLQALMYGYGGLRIVDNGLRLLRPTLPPSTGSLTLRGITWQGRVLDMVVSNTSVSLGVGAGGSDACITSISGGNVTVIGGATPVTWAMDNFDWPGVLLPAAC